MYRLPGMAVERALTPPQCPPAGYKAVVPPEIIIVGKTMILLLHY
jgi:hypothetical protein